MKLDMINPTTRSQIWQTLCTCFSPPVNEVWEHLLLDGSFSCMDPTGDLLPQFQDYKFQAGLSIDDLNKAYSSCFEVGNAPVSFHERTYKNDAASKLFEELFRYYEYFGLDLKDNENTHWPDSILVELDFMHYLSYLESIAANEEDIMSLQRGQRDFLKRHLCPLITGISDKLCTMGVTPYSQLSQLMNDYANQDRNYLAGIIDGIIISTVDG